MRRILPFVVLLALVGCKGGREKDVVGSWTSTSMSLTATEDKKFTSTIMGQLKIDGTWAVDGNDVTFTPVSLTNPITKATETVAAFKSRLASMPAVTANPQAKHFMDNLDTTNIMTLSEDGKAMNTNKEKDKNGGPPISMTKS